MKIRVIEGKCAGHARCATVAPQIFMLNDDGYLEMPGFTVPPDLEVLAR